MIEVTEKEYRAIKFYKEAKHYDAFDLASMKVRAEDPGNCHAVKIIEFVRLNGLEKYFRALIQGCMVKKTPEEEVLRCYRNTGGDNWGVGYREGVVKTLETLNIKIEGINK